MSNIEPSSRPRLTRTFRWFIRNLLKNMMFPFIALPILDKSAESSMTKSLSMILVYGIYGTCMIMKAHGVVLFFPLHILFFSSLMVTDVQWYCHFHLYLWKVAPYYQTSPDEEGYRYWSHAGPHLFPFSNTHHCLSQNHWKYEQETLPYHLLESDQQTLLPLLVHRQRVLPRCKYLQGRGSVSEAYLPCQFHWFSKLPSCSYIQADNPGQIALGAFPCRIGCTFRTRT